MITECNPLDPATCAGDVIGGIVGSAASSAWDSVCKSFADAAVSLLKTFAGAFVSFPNTDVKSLTSTYAISMWVAGGIAAILLLGQVIRTAVTHDGSAIAHGLVGLGKALIAFMITLTVANVAMQASDEITRGIIDRSLGGDDGLKKSLTGLFEFTSSGQATAPMSLILILALVGIVLTLVLWFEMLMRNAAIAVLIATSPIAAAGQISESTKGWWSKLCAATIQLIVLKPIIALVFAIGFGVLRTPADTSKPGDIATLLMGMLILLLAVVAWPVIAKFFTFASVNFAGGGMAGMLGFAAGRANSGSGGPAGVNPDQFSQATEARTMAASGGQATSMGAGEAASTMGASTASGSAGAAGAGAGASAGAVGALGAVALPLAVAAAGIDVAQRAVNSLSGRMEQMAGHAGIDGANPYSKPAGHPQYGGSWSGAGGSSQPAPPQETDRSSSVATLDPPAQAGVMPETRTTQIPADLGPPPVPPQPTYTSPIEEVGR